MPAPSARPPQFRFETEMAAAVVAHFLRSGEGYVGAELEVGVRAPDLVFGVAKESVLEARLRRGPALETELEVRLVERLEAEPASSDQLKSWAPWGWRNLRETALPALVVRGVIACTAETWHLATDVAPAFSSLVAVELKLSDWRYGIRQAWQNRAFAEHCWLVLGTCTPRPEAVELARRSKVGLARLCPGGEVDEIVAPLGGQTLCQTARRLAGEELLGRLLEQREPGVEKPRPLAGSPRGRQLAVGR